MGLFMKRLLVMLFTLCWAVSVQATNTLVETVQQVKPSVVGIGVFTPTGQPKNKLYGSGFVIGDGLYIVTNQHVVPDSLDESLLQQLAVFIGSGRQAETRTASLVATDKTHDLAILKINGTPLPALTLADKRFLPEGSSIAFTGFPIGAVLGLYPVTHRGIIAAVTPTVTPVDDARNISITVLKRLREPYLVYQLDATAYPGNSGSAMYDIERGHVVGVINKVFVQESKEAVISKPSGITYAIPVRYLHQLLQRHNIVI